VLVRENERCIVVKYGEKEEEHRQTDRYSSTRKAGMYQRRHRPITMNTI